MVDPTSVISGVFKVAKAVYNQIEILEKNKKKYSELKIIIGKLNNIIEALENNLEKTKLYSETLEDLKKSLETCEKFIQPRVELIKLKERREQLKAAKEAKEAKEAKKNYKKMAKEAANQAKEFFKAQKNAELCDAFEKKFNNLFMVLNTEINIQQQQDLMADRKFNQENAYAVKEQNQVLDARLQQLIEEGNKQHQAMLKQFAELTKQVKIIHDIAAATSQINIIPPLSLSAAPFATAMPVLLASPPLSLSTEHSAASQPALLPSPSYAQAVSAVQVPFSLPARHIPLVSKVLEKSAISLAVTNDIQFDIDNCELVTNEEIFASEVARIYKGKFNNDDVAIKRYQYVVNDQTKKLFIEEVKQLKNLRHENIISILGAALEQQQLCLVMMYASNQSLYNFLKLNLKLSIQTQFTIARGIAEGLNYLHTQHPLFYHQRLDSTHVLLDEKMIPKITGFKLLKSLALSAATYSSQSQIELKEEMNNTISNMSANQIELNVPNHSLDKNDNLLAKADIYSYGMILNEIFTASQTAKIPSDYEELIRNCMSNVEVERPSAAYCVAQNWFAQGRLYDREAAQLNPNTSDIEKNKKMLYSYSADCYQKTIDIAKTNANQIHAAAYSSLGYTMMRGRFDLINGKSNYKKAFELLSIAAANGYIPGMINLAGMYMEGHHVMGCEQNMIKPQPEVEAALNLYQQALEKIRAKKNEYIVAEPKQKSKIQELESLETQVESSIKQCLQKKRNKPEHDNNVLKF